MLKERSRRDFLKIAGLGTVAASLAGRGAQAKATRPNLIFIMADDLGYGDLGCYRQKNIKTPELDKMAEGGIRLTRFYAGYTVCLPSRCALMTGLHTGHARCRKNGGGGKHPEITEEDTTVAAVLKAAGYKTAMTGKWALGDRFVGCAVGHQNKDGGGAIYKHGWDFYFGEPNQTYNHSYYLNTYYRYDRYGLVGKRTRDDRLEQVRIEGNSRKRTHYGHDLLVENALAFIDAVAPGAAKGEPFFLYVPFAIPHSKYEIPDLEPYAKAAGWSKQDKVYASMISRMDRNVGRMLERLRKHGIAGNTLVVFTSDNGATKRKSVFKSNGDLPGNKGSLSDGGVRVPGIAYWPGTIAAGGQSDHLCAFWDVLPTFAELAGIRGPEPIDGISMVPTLLGRGAQAEHRYLFFLGKSKDKSLFIRGEGETRPREEIYKEALTAVVVPRFTPTRL